MSKIARLGEPVVGQQDHAPVGFRADDPAGGLEDADHAGHLVGRLESVRAPGRHAFADDLPFRRGRRKARPDDGRAGQPVAHQVDSFAEDAAHHRQPHPDLAVDFGEAVQEGVAFRRGHLAGLHPGPRFGDQRFEQRANLVQISVRGKKEQIISRLAPNQGRQQRGELGQGSLPVTVAGGNPVRHGDEQMFRGKGRGNPQPLFLPEDSEHPGEGLGRGQGGGEEDRSTAAGEGLVQRLGGVGAEQPDRPGRAFAGGKHRVGGVEGPGHPGEPDGLEKGLGQRPVERLLRVGTGQQPGVHPFREAFHRVDQGFRRRFRRRDSGRKKVELVRDAQQIARNRGKRFAETVPEPQQVAAIQRGGKALPRPVRQVVGFVEKKDPVRPPFPQMAAKGHPGIDRVVEIANHQIGPERQVQGQLVRTKRPGFARRRDPLRGEGGFGVEQIDQGLVDPVKITRRHGAFRPDAGPVRVQTGPIPGGKAHRSQPQPRRPERGQRGFRRDPPRGSGGQEEDSGRVAVRQRLDRREQRRHGFSHAGGGLGQQPLAVPQRPEHADRQFPLAGPPVRKGEFQGPDRFVPGRPQLREPGKPMKIPLHQDLAVVRQFLSVQPQFRLPDCAGNQPDVDQPEPNGREVVFFRVQPAVQVKLTPVDRIGLGQGVLRGSAGGFDLLHDHAVLGLQHAVDPSGEMQRDPLPLEPPRHRHFRLVTRRPGFLHPLVGANPLQGPGRAQGFGSQVSGPEQEFRRSPDGDGMNLGQC